MRRSRPIPTRRNALAACAALPAVLTGMTQAQGQSKNRKPRLVPGKDPGGIAVALVGAGVDYTDAAIAARLARDGEGEAIAFDAIDGDAQPFEAPPPGWATPLTVAGTDMARHLLDLARGCRLIPIRVSDQNVTTLAKAVRFAGRTPARVAVLLTGPGRDDGHELLAGALQAHPHMLAIMPANMMLRFLEKEVPLAYGLGNLAVVTAATEAGAAVANLSTDAARIDVAVGLQSPVAPAGLDPRDAARWIENRAAISLAAVAGQLLAEKPSADGAALKVRLMALARPAGGLGGVRTQSGVIIGADALKRGR